VRVTVDAEAEGVGRRNAVIATMKNMIAMIPIQRTLFIVDLPECRAGDLQTL
jgi:hypothetical protein